jgi:serine/threonine protein kinase
LKEETNVLFDENLHHINIVRYLTFFEDMPYGYLIMELCEEGNLEEYSKKFNNNIIPEEVLLLFFYFILYLNKKGTAKNRLSVNERTECSSQKQVHSSGYQTT